MAVKTKDNLNVYIVESIREKILSRQYAPGTKLPNEYELAEEYGVCRYTLREAIKRLIATGLVTVVRGKGTYVNELIPSDYFKLIIEKLILGDQDVNEIFETRIAIEQKTASLAAEKALPREIEEMNKTITKMQQALDHDQFLEFDELDIFLHNQIAIASKNRLLNDLIHILNDLIRYSIVKASLDKAKHLISLEGHVQIIKAIERRDTEEAASKMIHHLSFCKGLF